MGTFQNLCNTLHLLNCRTYHQKHLIACTAIKSNNTLVDWGEHYFYHLLTKQITFQSMIEYENLRRQITEETCIDISKFKTPFVIVSENNTKIFN